MITQKFRDYPYVDVPRHLEVAKLFDYLSIYIFSKVKPIYLIDYKIVQLSQEIYFEN